MAITVNALATTQGSSYGDLSTEDALVIQSKMLPIAKRNLTMARFAQKDTKAKGEGLVVRHRRYKKFAINDTPLAEGVTPDFDSLESEVISHVLKEYGRYVNITDLMELVNQDPYTSIISERQAQQAAETMDMISYKKFRAGTNVFYGNGTQRSAVNCKITGPMIQKIVRNLEASDTRKIAEIVRATEDVATTPIRESFFGICHPNLRYDLESIDGFIPVEQYSDSTVALPSEMGAYKGVRFIATTQAEPYFGAGAAGGTNVLETLSGGVNKADVYPILIFGKDAVGCATLGGVDSIIPTRWMPKPTAGDPLGQRGTIGYKYFYSCVILNDDWYGVAEVACSSL